MGALTLNNACFPKISNAHIFRTTHRNVMIFSSKCRWKVIWQILSTCGTVEYSTGPMRTHKEPTNWTWKFDQKLLGWKHQKLLVGQKNDFFKVQDIDTPIQPRKKKHQTSISLTLKTFQDHLRWLWDNCKTFDFFPAKNPSRGKSLRKESWEGKTRKFCNYLRYAASGPKTFLGPN